MKKLAVMVTTPPNVHQTKTAYQLIHSAMSEQVKVIGVFFYQAGVLNASKHLSVPSDEFPLKEKWQQLAKNVPLYLCSTAAEKHGLIIPEAPESTDLIDNAFTLAGLGELVELSAQADRMVQL